MTNNKINKINKLINRSFKIEEELDALIRSKHVNVSELVRTLLLDWTNSKKSSSEQLRQDVREAKNEVAISQARLAFLEKKLKERHDQMRLDDVEQFAERHNQWGIMDRSD